MSWIWDSDNVGQARFTEEMAEDMAREEAKKTPEDTEEPQQPPIPASPVTPSSEPANVPSSSVPQRPPAPLSFKKIGIFVAVVAGALAVSIVRINYGLSTNWQIGLTIAIALGVLAYTILTSDLRTRVKPIRRTQQERIYETEVAAIRQQSRQYSASDAQKFQQAHFSKEDAQTFRTNLTEAREAVMTWEFVVRQTGYLTLLETSTYGLNSAKKIIGDIRANPIKMLEYGDFLYQDLPNVVSLCVEFRDLTSQQKSAQIAVLNLIKKLSAGITQEYENVQLDDVQQVVQNIDNSLDSRSARELGTQGLAGKLESMKSTVEDGADTSTSDFDRLQHLFTTQEQAQAEPEKVQRAKFIVSKNMDVAFSSLVIALCGFVWAPMPLAIFCTIAAFFVGAFSFQDGPLNKNSAVAKMAQDLERRGIRVEGVEEPRVYRRSYGVYLMVSIAFIFAFVTFFAMSTPASQVIEQDQEGTEAVAQGDIDGDGIDEYTFNDPADPENADELTMSRFLDLSVVGREYGATSYQEVMQTYGAPHLIFKSIGEYDRTFIYGKNPLRNGVDLSEGEIDLDFSGEYLFQKTANDLGDVHPFNWSVKDLDSLTTIDREGNWLSATNFAEIRSKHGEPKSIQARSRKFQGEDREVLVATYRDDASYPERKEVRLVFIRIFSGEYRMSAVSDSNVKTDIAGMAARNSQNNLMVPQS